MPNKVHRSEIVCCTRHGRIGGDVGSSRRGWMHWNFLTQGINEQSDFFGGRHWRPWVDADAWFVAVHLKNATARIDDLTLVSTSIWPVTTRNWLQTPASATHASLPYKHYIVTNPAHGAKVQHHVARLLYDLPILGSEYTCPASILLHPILSSCNHTYPSEPYLHKMFASSSISLMRDN